MILEEPIETFNLKVKLRAGASVVKIRPLFTYDSKCIIIASGSDVKVYSIQSGECLHTLRYHKACVVSLQENKNNHLQIFSCSEDGIVVRWDYSGGKSLEVYNLHMPATSFYAPNKSSTWFVTKKAENQDNYRLYSFIPKLRYSVDIHMLINPVIPSENTVAFGFEGEFVAGVYDNVLTIVQLKPKSFAKHLTGERKLRCVTCHPSDFVLATGDDQGRVLVWSNLMAKSPIRSIYHWHTLPVADIAFSTEGCYLYSGGGEAALVKWNLFSDEKEILPRLGAPIHRLSVSPSNGYVVTAHNDNSLQIINSQRNVIQVIQGLTQGHFQGDKSKNILPTGLLYDSHTKAIVMNGKPGHLQFYNIEEDKQLFNLDISGRNFITQERENVVLNIDVQKAAIDDNGRWLATAEYWDDEETSPQIWLKFWEFDVSKQTFVLNTNVTLPHNKEVNCILFRPFTSSDELPLAITTSNDCRFKIWLLKEDAGFAGKMSWTCESMGCYRDLPAGDACFSEEGSLLAVAFGNVATLWTVDTTTLKAVLCHEKKNKNKIKQLVFGRQSCSHLLICHDQASITVWNVLSLSITWIVHTEIQTLVVDNSSQIIAAFCEDQSLILFKPDNPAPIHSIENVSQQSIIAAIFVPLKEHNRGPSFLEKSQLFFFDADQNLLTLTDECDDERRSNKTQKAEFTQNLPVTPFGMLQAESTVSNVEIFEPQTLMGIPMDASQELGISCPTLMDPLALCSKVLKSLLIPAPKKEI